MGERNTKNIDVTGFQPYSFIIHKLFKALGIWDNMVSYLSLLKTFFVTNSKVKLDCIGPSQINIAKCGIGVLDMIFKFASFLFSN